MKKVITYGTFDLFHQGHYNILKRAKEYGDYLIVGVTGENYDIGRGKLSVHDSLATRIENVKKTGFADEIIVEEYLGQKIQDIVCRGVDTFVIGDDWKGKFDHLGKYCNMVYLERTRGVSSTMLREEKFHTYLIGLVADIADDNQIVSEAAEVGDFKVASVYSEDDDVKKELQKKYGIEHSSKSLDSLIRKCEIVYIRTSVEKRADIIEKALRAGRHVICDPPFALKADKQKELLDLARENNVILIENIKMVHIHVFNQLLWYTQGGLIGDILSFNCSISRIDQSRDNIFDDLLYMALCPTLKIMGLDYSNIDVQLTGEGGTVDFASIDFKYKRGRVIINVGNNVKIRNRLEIVGSKGTIRVEGNWWRGNYFELEEPDNDEVQIFNTNYHGNGFKYLLRAVSSMIEDNRIDSMGMLRSESMKAAEIIETVDSYRK